MPTTVETAPLTIRDLSCDGRGIATLNQKIIFIAGALPGETVHYRLIKKHRHYSEAVTTNILNPSPERTTPPCPHIMQCGGCSLQHLTKTAELRFKQQWLLEQLHTIGQVTPREMLLPLVANAVGYRRKARLGVRWVAKKNKLLIGFREKAGRYLADLTACLVLHERIGQQFEALRTLLMSLSIYRDMPQIEVAIGDDDQVALLFRHLQPLSQQDEMQLKQFGNKHHIDIYAHPTPPLPLKQLWQTDLPERLKYSLPEEQLTFLFHPLDFTQIHLEMNRLMVSQALAMLDIQPGERVLDLYCGIGNFTLPIAKRGGLVTGIEGNESMVQRAQENARHNQIDSTQFFSANLETIQTAQSTSWFYQKYDKILLDPPRIGAKNILFFIEQWQAKRIVYISCNPATLARDANFLTQHKYCLHKAGIMNMFPHTSHTEVMAVFEREE